MKITGNKNWKIGVAVSGGADSMALLDCYNKIGQNIVVINIEHGLRGESSIKDSQFVKDYCAEHGIECWAFSVHALKEAKKNKESAELAARKLRYQVFDRLLEEKKVDRIALAHHANDNMETVLMRLFRGTGIRGIIGIRDRGHYIHPLLKYTREEILYYVKKNNIPYVEDETNLCNDFSRNYIRNKIVPVIKKKFGDVEGSFTRLCQNAAEVEAYIETQILQYEKKGDKYSIKKIFEAPKLIRKYSINKVLAAMGCVQDIENRHYDYILMLENKPLNTIISLPYDLIAVRDADGLTFSKLPEYETYSSQFFPDKQYKFGEAVYSFAKGGKIVNGITMDLDKVPHDAVVRTRNEGDKFKRVNGRTKLLSDYLTDKKISVLDKQRLLFLAKDSEIYAILGMETSDKVKVDENTKNIIHIIKEKNNK